MQFKSFSTILPLAFSLFTSVSIASPVLMDVTCRSKPAVQIFGHLDNYSSATSFCSHFIGSTSTVTVTSTVFDQPFMAHITPFSEPTLPPAPGPAATADPAVVSAACSCLVPIHAAVVTATRTMYEEGIVPPPKPTGYRPATPIFNDQAAIGYLHDARALRR